MIGEDRIEAYLDSLDRGNTHFLNELEEVAKASDVPIIRRPTQNLIRFLLELKKPQKILEVGTAIGFSAIMMAQYSTEDAHITTIEKYEKRIPIAEENFERSGFAGKITFLKGDATDILEELKDKGESYDMIFMDAAKGQYMNFLVPIKEMMKSGSLLISDNVLQDGDIIESRFAVTRRNRTIHSRMREYLYTLTHDDDFTTDILPIGDGVALTVRK